MDWFFGALLSGIWQAFLGKIGLSTDRKLGREEVIDEQQAKALKEVADAKRIDDINNRLSLDALKLRTHNWKRDS